MLDLPAPPFRTGDVAYTRPSPGGYASTATTPTDPAFSGNDRAYTVPALGGDFQPGSTTQPVSKGSAADGGAQAIADAPRVDEPPAQPPIVPAELAGTVNGGWVVFSGVPTADAQIDVSFDVEGVPTTVVAYAAEGDSAGVVAAKVTARLVESGWLNATQTSNAVEVRHFDGSIPEDLAVVVTITTPPP